MSAHRTCGSCRGTGTEARWYSDGSFDPTECETCGGAGAERLRDERGRFAAAPAPVTADPERGET